MTDNNKVNREYKSSLFSCIFSKKEYALQLYNALNNSDYNNPEDIEITTLENVVFINIYNDVSFMFNNTVQFYEHQSTFNPNMPLRNLFYLSNTYEKLIRQKDEDLYGSTLIQIPTPTCIVFYNGIKSEPDKKILKLSDSFINQKIEGSLELIVQMININYDYNLELMKKCEALYGYSLYISKVREYNMNEEYSIKESAIKALDYCIDNNVLADFFSEKRNEVVGMILEEYNMEHVEQRMDRMYRKLENMEQEIQIKVAELQSKDAELQSKDAELQSKDAELQSKDAELQSKDAEIARLKQLLKNSDISL